MTDKLDRVQEAILEYDTYKPQGRYGVTSLEKPRYRVWVENENPGVDCTKPVGKIDSKIGTGFHLIAEQAMEHSDIKCEVEKVLKGKVGKYEVGGTCDLILLDDLGIATVCDFKTMKAYPAKKAFNQEETAKFVKQLSLYAYLLKKAGYIVEPVGYIYVFVVGWTARDRNIPRTFRLDFTLMTTEEVKAYVDERIQALKNPTMDCPTWMCEQYCGVRDVCPHHNNHEFKKTV